jgi:hypothetical protein
VKSKPENGASKPSERPSNKDTGSKKYDWENLIDKNDDLKW